MKKTSIVLTIAALLLLSISSSTAINAQEIKSPEGKTWFVLKDGNKLDYPTGVSGFRFSNDSIFVGNNYYGAMRTENGRLAVYEASTNFMAGYFVSNTGQVFGYKDDYRGEITPNGEIKNKDGVVVATYSNIDKKLLGCVLLILW